MYNYCSNKDVLNALDEFVDDYGSRFENAYGLEYDKIVKALMVFDAVVQCRDCVYFAPSDNTCVYECSDHGQPTTPVDFCSRGKENVK